MALGHRDICLHLTRGKTEVYGGLVKHLGSPDQTVMSWAGTQLLETHPDTSVSLLRQGMTRAGTAWRLRWVAHSMWLSVGTAGSSGQMTRIHCCLCPLGYLAPCASGLTFVLGAPLGGSVPAADPSSCRHLSTRTHRTGVPSVQLRKAIFERLVRRASCGSGGAQPRTRLRWCQFAKGRTAKMAEQRRWFVENKSRDAVLSLRLASRVLQSKAGFGFMTSCSPRGKVLIEHGSKNLSSSCSSLSSSSSGL